MCVLQQVLKYNTIHRQSYNLKEERQKNII